MPSGLEQNLEGNAHSQNQASVADLVDNSSTVIKALYFEMSCENICNTCLKTCSTWHTSSNELQSNCELNLMNLAGVIMDLTLNSGSICRS